MSERLSLQRAACRALMAALAVGCAKTEQTPGPSIVTTAFGEMALVPAGSFAMGDDAGEPDEAPVHQVRIDAFLIDTCEVTQEQFSELRKKAPAHFKNPRNPVEQVSWADAAFYCNARSRADGLKPCYDETTGACDFEADGYRLPTEAEWEYACRAGAGGAFSFGDDPAKLVAHAWFKDNAGGKPHPVGTKKPNAWGIHDMHGNVVEWCNDVYGATHYAAARADNPRGPAEDASSKFVLRGGAWDSGPDACRSAYRVGEIPGQVDGCFRRDEIGFRCVRKAPPQ